MGKNMKQHAGLSRRTFISTGTVSIVGSAFLPEIVQALAQPTDNSIIVRLVRDVDLMQLEARFIRFRKRDGWIEPLPSGGSLIALRFPPQNLAEAIFDDIRLPGGTMENEPLTGPATAGNAAQEGKNDPAPPVPSYLSGPSWIVFDVPGNLRFPLNNVEQWFSTLSRCDLRTPRGALPPSKRGRYRPVPPREDETRLEIPFRLYISPEPDVRTIFSKATTPETKYAELWQAALESRHPVQPAGSPPGMSNLPDELKPPSEVVLHSRAIWSPDYRPDGEPEFSLYYPGYQPLSLHALTRHRLVKQMGDGDGWIDAEHLVLTAIGADANFHYSSQKSVSQIIKEQLDNEQNESASGTELRIWKHRIVVGRDVFFAEAFFGFLFPFVHPAVYVEITKRKAASYRKPDGKLGPLGFHLLKRRFILVQDPLKTFGDSASAIGRLMPAKKMKVTTVRSPDLEAPANVNDPKTGSPPTTGLAFWPHVIAPPGVPSVPVSWELEAEDESGVRGKSTHAELFFSTNILVGDRIYNAAPESKRTVLFPGVRFAFANERSATVIVDQPGPAGAGRTPSTKVVLDEDGVALAKLMATKFSNEMRGLDPQRALARLETIGKDALNGLKRSGSLAAEKIDALERQLKTLAAALSQWSGQTEAEFKKAYTGLLDNLSNADRVAAGLETQAMTFSSACLQQFGKDANDALNRLAGDPSLDALLTFLEGQRFPVHDFKHAPRENIISWLKSIKEAANAQGESAEARARELLGQITNLQNEAKTFGSEFFHPLLTKADVVIPALKDVLPDAPVRTIRMFEDYIAGGIQSVRSGVFAKLDEVINTGEKLAQGVKNGIAQPAASIAGLSREIGAVIGNGEQALKDIARKAGDFDLKDAIPDAKLFGVIPLRELIGLLGRGELPDINRFELPEKIERIWQWSTAVSGKKFGVLELGFNTKFKNRLFILSRATLPIPRPGSPKINPEFRLHGWLGRWDETRPAQFNGVTDLREIVPSSDDYSVMVELLSLIRVKFGYVRFDASYSEGQMPAPSIDANLRGVEFLGPLKFLSQLQRSFSKFGKFSVEPTLEYLKITQDIELPPISFGAFSMRSLRLMNRLSLPFGSTPLQYNFAFASFAKPFELSVMGFAGRGFFSAGFRTDGYRELEGALEFGGSLSFDVGVASGGLYVMAGFYFKITNNETTLSGYLRAGGNLDVLGLIHANVEFLLMMTYRTTNTGSELYGSCTVTVSIDLFLVSMDVSIEMKKHIAGSNNSTGHQRIAFDAQRAMLALSNGSDNQRATALVASLSRSYEGLRKNDTRATTRLGDLSTRLANPVANRGRAIEELARIRDEALREAKRNEDNYAKGRPFIRRKGWGKGEYQFESAKQWRSQYWNQFEH